MLVSSQLKGIRSGLLKKVLNELQAARSIPGIAGRPSHVADTGIVFRTDIFHQFAFNETGAGKYRKRFGVGNRIVNRDFPFQRLRVDASETFNSVQLF